MYKLLLIVLFNTLLFGCSSIPQYGELFSNNHLSQVPKDKARLVIYKKGVNSTNDYAGAFIDILIDGNKTGGLAEGSFIIRDVTPSTHKVTAAMPFMSRPAHAMMLFKDMHIEKTFIANKIYFINYQIIAEPIVRGPYETYQEFNDVKFIEQAYKVAIEQLKSCRLLKGFEPLDWNKKY